MDFRVVHMADQTGTDSAYWYTDGYRNRDPASWTEPGVYRNDWCHNLPHRKLPDNHKCCQNTGTSSHRLTIRNGLSPDGMSSPQIVRWMSECNKHASAHR